MIRLSRLNGKEFILNADQILYVEATPDTVITLTNGNKIMVKEPVSEVVNGAIDYRKRLYQEAIGRGQSWT